MTLVNRLPWRQLMNLTVLAESSNFYFYFFSNLPMLRSSMQTCVKYLLFLSSLFSHYLGYFTFQGFLLHYNFDICCAFNSPYSIFNVFLSKKMPSWIKSHLSECKTLSEEYWLLSIRKLEEKWCKLIHFWCHWKERTYFPFRCQLDKA